MRGEGLRVSCVSLLWRPKPRDPWGMKFLIPSCPAMYQSTELFHGSLGHDQVRNTISLGLKRGVSKGGGATLDMCGLPTVGLRSTHIRAPEMLSVPMERQGFVSGSLHPRLPAAHPASFFALGSPREETALLVT